MKKLAALTAVSVVAAAAGMAATIWWAINTDYDVELGTDDDDWSDWTIDQWRDWWGYEDDE